MVRTSTRTDWSLKEAVFWAHDLNDARIYDPNFILWWPSMRACLFAQSDTEWTDAGRAVLNALKDSRLRAWRLAPDGTEQEIASGFWNDKYLIFLDDMNRDITVRAADVMALWRGKNSLPLITKSAGRYKGGDPARDAEILAKFDLMKNDQPDGRKVAKQLPKQPGFGDVSGQFVRELAKGRYKQGNGDLRDEQ